MKGYIMAMTGAGGGTSAGLQFIENAVDLLEWGQGMWKDVPITDKGVVFKNTFVRAVRLMRLEALVKVRFILLVEFLRNLTIRFW